MRPGARAQLGRSDVVRERLPVGPVGRHRAPRVARADDARAERDVSAREGVRIARSVPALVAGADDAADIAEEAADLLEHLLAEDRVRLHDLPLRVVERAGLVDDLRRHLHLADVVQERSELRLPALGWVETELVCDGEHELDDVATVAAGVL